MHTRRLARFGIFLLCLLLWTYPSLALPPIPLHVIGRAVAMDGSPVPEGIRVTASCAGAPAGAGITISVSGEAMVVLNVEGDDLETDLREGCRDGEAITFRIGGTLADESATWHAEALLGDWEDPFVLTAGQAVIAEAGMWLPVVLTQ